MRIPLLALFLVLLAVVGCRLPWIPRPLPPTPSPSPQATPSLPVPSPTPTPLRPLPTPTPPPSPPSATPTPSLPYDLAIRPPPGWESALIASPFRDAKATSPFLGPDAPYISWAVENLGPGPAPSPALVDLSLDGVLVERWRIPPLEAGERFSILNWGELLQRVRLTPGTHTLTLTIDPIGLLREQNPANNTLSVSFLWTGPPLPLVPPEELPYLPDLTLFTPPGWSAPMEVVPKEAGKTQVRVAVRNRGRSSADRRTFVDLRVNGMIATRWAVPPLLPGQEAVLEWDSLLDTMALPPGRHTLVVTVDATGLQDEAREDNNSYTLTLLWPPAQENAPRGFRLVPYAFPGMGDALVLSSLPGQFAVGPVERGHGVWAHWGVRNAGNAALPQPLAVEMLLNGSTVARWTRPALGPGEVDVLLDQPLPSALAQLPTGVYQVALIAGLATESGAMGQVLLRVERQVAWVERSPDPPPTPSPEEIRRLLGRVGRLLEADGSEGQDGIALAQDILAVASALYAVLYGRPLEAEGVDVLFLPYLEWARWVQKVCADQSSALPVPQQASYYTSCLHLQSANALTTRWRGRLRIGLMAQRSPIEVLRDLGHEMGHLRQMLVNPRLDQAPDTLDLRALREAQGFLHEALFVRLLEERTGLDMSLYPRTPLYAQWAQEALTNVHLQRDGDEYARGIALLWTALLSDDNLRQARNDLLLQGKLGITSLRSAFVYLLSISPDQAEGYARRHLARWEGVRTTLEGLLLGRLVLGLPLAREGVGAFRGVGLLLP
ncbi:hypothetical protein HRbin23_00489 [bacterium HR23]|nr:hypothetical protein HRbin23_00489 [bacterium HR23]